MIYVLAGVNGAGKSSIGGSNLRAAGRDWFNPDEIAREMQQRFPERRQQDVDSQVGHEGKRRLEQAVRDRTHFAFETTLGGNTITGLLLDAMAAGISVNIWYCGLESPELHIERVAARVARGGHDIPEHRIRTRYRSSMQNLCRLALGLHRLAVFDNSKPLGDDGQPNIRQLLHVVNNTIEHLERDMLDWAKPVAAVCLQHSRKG